MKRIAWVCGWGVNPESLSLLATKTFPQAQHRFYAPLEPDLQRVKDFDGVIGWSLGAWRLLQEGGAGLVFGGKVILLAPFLAFCADHALGGRCAKTHVKWLKRWLGKDPTAALQDFHRRAGIRNLKPAEISPALDAGLDRLLQEATTQTVRFAAELPPNWSAVIGDQDELLIAREICINVRGCRIIGGAGHDPASLVNTVAHEI